MHVILNVCLMYIKYDFENCTLPGLVFQALSSNMLLNPCLVFMVPSLVIEHMVGKEASARER